MKKLFASLGALLLLAAGVFITTVKAQNPSTLSRAGGIFYAPAFAWQGRLVSGNTATGSQSVILVGSTGGSGGIQLADGTTVSLNTVFSTLNPVIFDLGQGAQESVTPTAISIGTCPAGNIGVGGSVQCVTFTGSFSNTHGQSAVVADGAFGLQTAVNYAHQLGGGVVHVDSAWNALGGTNAMLTASVPFSDVSIMDSTNGQVVYWNPQGGLTTLAAPTALVANTSVTFSTTPAGSYTTAAAYFICIAYVDIDGQEGPCSGTMSTTPGTTLSSATFAAPAASAGAVGYVPYISLTSGTYQLAYKVPLVTQPTANGVYPVSNNVCTLTTVETVTPACAVTNSTYNQTGSTAVVTALTLNTSPIDPQVTTVSTTAVYTPNAGGRTTFTYVPSSHVGTFGSPAGFLPFTISAADATTVPSVLGTINVAPGLMNYVGRTIEICGKATTTATTASTSQIQFQWDSMGMNTAGKGVQIGNLSVTPAVAFATVAEYTFCEDFMTTVAGPTATGGSIINAGGYISAVGASAVAPAGIGTGAAGSDTFAASTASLNLAADARINVIYVHTTGTDGAALTLQSLTMKVVN